MTAKLTPAQKAARRAAKLRGQRLAARSPYHHEPVPDPVRRRCSICGEPMYGKSPSHSQCNFEDAIRRRWEENRWPPDLPAGGRDEEAGDGE